jgi:hypothetical protein
MNVEEQVNIIQEKFFDNDQRTSELMNTPLENKYMLRYIKEGYVEAVEMVIYENNFEIKIHIWDSENNPLEWIEEDDKYELFQTLLMRRLQVAFSSIRKAKIILE